MRLFHYGNNATLIIGILLMIADGFIPMAREFGAWPVGSLFCVWYSASAIKEDERIGKKLKRWRYVYLAIVLVLANWFYVSANSPSYGGHWSIQSSLKAMGVDGR